LIDEHCINGPGFKSEFLSDRGTTSMDVAGIVTELIAGGVGGNIAGAVLKKYNLGPIGNTISGLIGGGIGGQLLSMVLGGGAAAATGAAATGGGMDMSSILSSVGGGGIGGAVVMVIVGLIKAQMAKSSTT
jgi:uncharacterized membrane protein YeaQ/YmgE (transglycosylase-associated protein family)